MRTKSSKLNGIPVAKSLQAVAHKTGFVSGKLNSQSPDLSSRISNAESTKFNGVFQFIEEALFLLPAVKTA